MTSASGLSLPVRLSLEIAPLDPFISKEAFCLLIILCILVVQFRNLFVPCSHGQTRTTYRFAYLLLPDHSHLLRTNPLRYGQQQCEHPKHRAPMPTVFHSSPPLRAGALKCHPVTADEVPCSLMVCGSEPFLCHHRCIDIIFWLSPW